MNILGQRNIEAKRGGNGNNLTKLLNWTISFNKIYL
jgi:hypothetical protein